MTDYTRFVNTGAVDANGDGTTNLTTSGDNTHAYQSLALAEAAEATDIDTAGDSFIFQCEGSTADTTQVSLGTDWTTSATDNIKIEPHANDVNTTGVYSTSLYRLVQTTSHTACIKVTGANCGHVEINGIQAEVGSNNSDCIAINASKASGVYIVYGTILKGSGSGNAQRGVHLEFTGTSDAHVVNNVIYETGDDGIRLSYGVAGQVNIYNNTIDSTASFGIELPSGGSTQEVRNNLITNCTSGDYTAAGSPTTETNGTSDGSSPQTGLQDLIVTYTDAANDDYSTSDDEITGQGTDLSSDSEYPFNVDRNGVSRGASWDLGAFQHVASGTGNPHNYYAQLQ